MDTGNTVAENPKPAAMTQGDWVRLIFLILTGLLSLTCLTGGGSFYFVIVADWAEGGKPFSGFEMISWLLGVIAAGIVCLGLLFAGIFLRLLPWRKATLASLVLSALSVGFILATFLIFSDTGHDEDSIEVVVLQVLCVLVLFVTALPPFLHWLLAKRSAVVTPPTARKSEAG